MQTIWLDAECNNRCTFCWETYPSWVESKRNTHIMDTLKPEYDEDELLIQGVEPALHHRIDGLLWGIRDKGFKNITLRGNGRLFAYPAQCTRFIHAKVNRFIIYLFSSSIKAHDAISQVEGSFSQAVRGIRNLKRRGAEVELELLFCKESRYPPEEALKLVKDLDISKVSIRYVGHSMIPSPVTTFDFYQGGAMRIRDLLKHLRENRIKVSYDTSLIDFDLIFTGLKSETEGFPKSTREKNKVQALSDYERNALVAQARPLRLYVELTRNCNNHCLMCRARKKYDPSKDMPFETFKKIADELFPYAHCVDLRGWGESTIMREWDKYLDYAIKFPSGFALVTNMTVQNDAMWEKMVKNRFGFSVSFDAATKKTFEFIRRGSSFDTVCSNLRKVAGYYDKYGIDPPYLNMLMTVQKYNLHEVPGVVRLAKELGVRNVRLSPCYDPPEFSVYKTHSKKDIHNSIQQALEVGKEIGITVDLVGSFSEDVERTHTDLCLRERCDHPWTVMHITPDGTIGPCNHLLNPALRLGHVRDGPGYAWNSIGFQLFRKLIHTKNKLPTCDWCFKHRYSD